MAENGLREAPGALADQLEKPAHTAPNEENRGARVETPEPEKVLVEVLRGFIRHENGQPEVVTPKGSGLRQTVALLLFALDIALIYSQLEDWLQNPLFQQALKVVPWVLGATAVGYADRVRRFLMEQASHLKWAIIAAAFLVPLLIIQMPVFSVRVRLIPGTAEIKPAGGQVDVQPTTNPSVSRLTSALRTYKVAVSDSAANPMDAVPFTRTLGRWSILRGTLAQVPVLGRLLGRPETTMTPLYRVAFHSPEIKVNPKLFIAGQFSAEFLSVTECKPDSLHERSVLSCTIREGTDSVKLPPGTYDFTLVQGECEKIIGKQDVKAGKNDLIDSSPIACSKR